MPVNTRAALLVMTALPAVLVSLNRTLPVPLLMITALPALDELKKLIECAAVVGDVGVACSRRSAEAYAPGVGKGRAAGGAGVEELDSAADKVVYRGAAGGACIVEEDGRRCYW